jgi:uncharacterized protein YmfQ (DUF2313 family)
MIIIDKLIRLTRRLYPKGRALNMYIGSMLERVHKALARSERRIHNDSVEVLDTILPDNDNFTAVDATRWEERLGMITNSNVDLEDRKLAIKRKLNYPGLIRARQSIDYIQEQLNDAGFNVTCYRYSGLLPNEILTAVQMLPLAQHATTVMHMGANITHADPNDTVLYTDCVANNIIEVLDANFPIDKPEWTFVISSENIATFAEVPIERKDEFRQLILRLKPVNSVAFLFINYV